MSPTVIVEIASIIVPPLSLGATFLGPSLIISMICLLGVVVLAVASSRRGTRHLAPAAYCLLFLTVIVWGLYLWTVLL